ncbi:MAG: endonuclease/exonuclease/phosphatase family protein [Bacteroidia bacterium]
MNLRVGVFVLFSLVVFINALEAQMDTIKLISYNVLRFPAGNAFKAPLLRPIINYLQPDIVGLNELTNSNALDSLSKYVFSSTNFEHAQWVEESELMGCVFYRKDKIKLAKQFSLATAPRRTNVYTFYSANQDFTQHPDTVWLTCMLVHFKSSQGTSNEDLRAQQAADIRIYANNRPASNNYVLMGDLNLYGADEPAWTHLTAEGNAKFYDPINRAGSWSNNILYSDIHTQSPRTTSFDLGVTGGMDDRFDFILCTEAVLNGTYGMRIIPETYRAVGNDGNHFNQSILAQPENLSVPDSVLTALHDFSDHLPVCTDIVFDPNTVQGSAHLNPLETCLISLDQFFQNPKQYSSIRFYTIEGRMLMDKELSDLPLGTMIFAVGYDNDGKTMKCNSKLLIRQ